MNPSFAQAAPRPMHAGDPGYEVVLEAATAPLREAAGTRVALDVERIDRIGPWVFVLGNMRSPEGGRPDFSGTRFEGASSEGAMSDVYVVLLRHAPDAGSASPAAPAEAAALDQAGIAPDDAPAAAGPGAGDAEFPAGGTWVVLDHAIGPGDVAWLGWPQEHAAPRALFGF